MSEKSLYHTELQPESGIDSRTKLTRLKDTVHTQAEVAANEQLSLQSKVGQVLYEAAQASLEDTGTESIQHNKSAQKRFKEVKNTVGHVAYTNSDSEQPLTEQELSAKLKDESVTLKPGYGPIKKAMEVVVALRNNKQYPRLQPLVEQLLTQQEEPTVDQITGFIEQENIQIPNLSTEALLAAVNNARNEEKSTTQTFSSRVNDDTSPEVPAAPTVEATPETSSPESGSDRKAEAIHMHALVDRYGEGQLTKDEFLLLLATEDVDNTPTQQSPEPEIIPPNRQLALHEVNASTPEESTEQITAQELSGRYTQIAKKLQAGRLTIDAALDLVRNEQAPLHERRTTIQQIERFAAWSAGVVERNMGSLYDDEPKTKAEAQDRVTAWRKVKAVFADTQRKTRDAYSFAVRQARAFDAALAGELQSLGTDMMQGSTNLAEKSAQSLSAKISGEEPSPQITSANQEPIQNAPRRTHAQRVRAGLAAVKNVAQQFDEAIVNEIRALGADTAKATVRGTEKAAEKMGSYADRISTFTEDQMRKHEAALAQEKAAKQQKLEAQERATQQRLLVVELLKQAAAQLDAGNLTPEEARSAVLLEDSVKLQPAAPVEDVELQAKNQETLLTRRLNGATEDMALQFSYNYIKNGVIPSDEAFATIARKHNLSESDLPKLREQTFSMLVQTKNDFEIDHKFSVLLDSIAQDLTLYGKQKPSRHDIETAVAAASEQSENETLNEVEQRMAVAFVERRIEKRAQELQTQGHSATENTTDSTASASTQQDAAPASEPKPDTPTDGRRWNFGLGGLFGNKNKDVA